MMGGADTLNDKPLYAQCCTYSGLEAAARGWLSGQESIIIFKERVDSTEEECSKCGLA